MIDKESIQYELATEIPEVIQICDSRTKQLLYEGETVLSRANLEERIKHGFGKSYYNSNFGMQLEYEGTWMAGFRHGNGKYFFGND